jgi:lipid-A-disaccharide synthase
VREAPLIFLVAGEQSGDLLGGRLMAALRAQTADHVRFAGVGGERMTRQGLDSLFPMAELSIMGIAEVIPKIPKIKRLIDRTVAEIARLRPACIVTIDAPGFSFRVAKRAKTLGIPRIHYVAPSVWAWRPGRAREVARFLDHLMALLPFEPPYFAAEGLACTFVGHPAVEGGAGKGDGAAFRARHGIPADRIVAIMLPGSRVGEVNRILPPFIEAIKLLRVDRPEMAVVVPVVSGVARMVKDRLDAAGLKALTIEGDAEKFDAFAAAEIALAKSGTVTLELALAGVPTVIAYRLNPISHAILDWQKLIAFAGLPNIILGRQVMPELLQYRCKPDLLCRELARLLDDPEARRAQAEGEAEVRRRVSVSGKTPSAAAAETVLQVIRAAG